MIGRGILFALAMAIAAAPLPGAAAVAAPSHEPAAPSHEPYAAPQHNPLLTHDRKVRMSKLIGSEVYNDLGKKFGTVDDIVVSKQGQAQVVIRSDGKLYAVNWEKLRFGNADVNDHSKVVLPFTSKSALAGKPQYHYGTG